MLHGKPINCKILDMLIWNVIDEWISIDKVNAKNVCRNALYEFIIIQRKKLKAKMVNCLTIVLELATDYAAM